MALLFVRPVRGRDRGCGRVVGRRRLAVLAPRRHHLGVRVHDDLDHPVKAAAWSRPGRVAAGDRRRSSSRRRRRRRRPRRQQRRSTLGARAVPRPVRGCHGADGEGVAGPRARAHDEGAAAADFVLRTGRMPMADPTCRPSGARCGTRRSRDRRPRRPRRRRSATGPTSPTSTRQRRPRHGGAAVPAQLRGVPRRVGLGRRHRRRRATRPT